MKHIYTFKQFIQKPLLVALALLAMSSNAWGGAGDITFYASVEASPTSGGTVSLSPGTSQTKTSPYKSWKYQETSATFTYSATANGGYTFKGWSTNSSANSGNTTNPMSQTYKGTGNLWGTATKTADKYYAIFATMTADKSSIAFGSILKGVESDAVTVTVSHAHAGSITAALSGSHSGDFILSKTNIATSTTAGTATFTVKFKPKATGSRSATLTISSNNGLASISIALSGTGLSTVEPEYSCSIANEYHVGDAAINLNSLWTSTSPAAKVYSIKSFTPSGSNNSGATAPAVSGTNLSLGQAGTLVLGLTQAATTGYYAGSAEKTIIIKKRNNTLYVNGSASYNPTMTMDGELAIALTATNTDYSGSPISISQTAGSTIAVYNASTKKITSNINLGTATWSISQPENYKYNAAAGTFTVTVKKETETICTIYTNSGTEEFSGESSKYTWTDAASKSISFEAAKNMGTAIGDLEIYVRKNDFWSKLAAIEVGSLSGSFGSYEYKAFRYDLDREVTGVYFKNTGSYKRAVRNISVTRYTYFNPTMTSTSFTTTDEGNPIYRNQEGHQTLTVKWSIANGGDINIVSTNPKFTVSPNKITNTDCANGSNDITVTYTSADAGTDNGKIIVYNRVFRKEIDVTGTTSKRTQTIVWNTDLTTIPVGYDLSARTSENQPVTYESSDSDVIEVLPNGTLDVKAAGSATITAHGAANEEYNEVEDSKTFTVTNDLIQYIVWEQNLMNLKLGASNVTMTATAATDEVGEFPVRPITYTSSDESKVKVVNGNQLQIIAVGTAYVTATQAGGEDGAGNVFAAASPVQKKVVVRDPDAACENFVFQQNSDEEFFQMNTNEITGTTYTLSGEPEFLSVDLKRKYYTVLGMHIGDLGKYSKGNLILQQYVNGAWNDVRTFTESDMPVTDEGTSYKSFTNIPLNRKAKKIRFVRPEGGQGHHYVCNCEVTLARYIETNQTSINFGETAVGSLAPHNLQLSYNNIQDGLTLTTNHDAYTVSPSYIDGSCGDKGNQTITVTYNPQVASAADNATLTISDGKTSRVVSLTGSASKINRAIHWDDLPEYNTVNMYERIELNASVSLDYDASIQAGEVEYVYSTDSKSFVDGKVRFLTDGDFTITAQAPETNEYNAASEVTKHFHVLYRNDFTFEGQDAVWNDENNWNTGAEPVPASDVTIDEDVVLQTTATINSLTINEGKTLTIADGGVLNVGNGNSLSQATYGNIIVEAGGQLILGNGAVNVNDFTLYSGFDSNQQPKSGQVTGQDKLTTHGHAYFILDLDPSGQASYGWYTFAVPFPVDEMRGVSRYDNGQWTAITNGVNYAVMAYHEDLRAQGQKGWKKYSGILQPGVGYTMTTECAINRYRFTKTDAGEFNTSMVQQLQASAEGETVDRGWNSLGNGTMSYITLDEEPLVQIYDHASNTYTGFNSASLTFAVGAAYFVQTAANGSELNLTSEVNGTIRRAPQREQSSNSSFCLSLNADGKLCDNLFITCDDEAEPTYTIGRDVQKMGNTTGTTVARLWTNAKGTDLCAVSTQYADNQAIIPMHIFAPADGEYTLSLDSHPADDVYLTRNGIIVWDMNMGDYTFDLSAGADDSYALQVVRRVQNVATGVDAVDADNHGTIFAEKMIVNGQLFILRDGMLFDAQGKKVTNL